MDGGALVSVTPEGRKAFRLKMERKSSRGKAIRLSSIPSMEDSSEAFQPSIPDLTLAGSGQSGRYVSGAERPAVPLKLYRYDTVTGERKPWRDLVPADRAGAYVANIFDITPDARWYAYSYVRDLSDLYLVDGLR